MKTFGIIVPGKGSMYYWLGAHDALVPWGDQSRRWPSFQEAQAYLASHPMLAMLVKSPYVSDWLS
jgi:hypothetical protein